jgi:UDP-N-acetylmuramate-alanine ligase/very-short-patch-repair endonuclease
MHVFISGIGGSGMSGIAQLCLDSGLKVSGSDLEENFSTKKLAKQGAKISFEQTLESIQKTHQENPIDWFIHTSSVKEGHAELTFAKENEIKINKRDGFLNYLIKKHNLKLLAVAGTHGKTTTSAMLTWLFKSFQIPVSYLIGTNLSWGNNAQYNKKSEYFVLEADEFDRNFLEYSPEYSLIPSIEYDHPDIYPTKESYYQAFQQFFDQTKKGIIGNLDNSASLKGWQTKSDGILLKLQNTQFPFPEGVAGQSPDGVVLEIKNKETLLSQKTFENNNDNEVVLKQKRNSKKYLSLPYNPKLKENAKKLRKAGVLSEVILWNKIKNNQLLGLDFDRQKIIGNYIVDFYCPNLGIVVEIDGESHDFKGVYDIQRETYLKSLDLKIVHFEDKRIKNDLNSVLQELSDYVSSITKTTPPAIAGTPPMEGNNNGNTNNSASLKGWQTKSDGVVSSSQKNTLPLIKPYSNNLTTPPAIAGTPPMEGNRKISLPGLHNRQNASLAIELFQILFPEKKLEEIIEKMNEFPGTARRFEKLTKNLYTDYAHHPTEIKATLQLASEVNDDIIAVYQPHQNSRQHEVKEMYKDVFKNAKKVYWLDTYLTRENPDLKILDKTEISKFTQHQNLELSEMNNDLIQKIQKHLDQNQLVLCMGAGTIDKFIRNGFLQK